MKKAKIFLIGGCFGLLFLDILMKMYTYFYIPKMSWIYPVYPFGGIPIFKDFLGISFSINHIENLGAAWGIFAQYSKYLIFLRVFIVLGLLAYLIFHKEKKNIFAIMLIITGAVGNILDFLFYGKVIDMFHFRFGSYTYPIFNLADTYITIGIFLLLISFLISRKKQEKNAN
jgi:signal peptidase II